MIYSKGQGHVTWEFASTCMHVINSFKHIMQVFLRLSIPVLDAVDCVGISFALWAMATALGLAFLS